MTEQPVVGNQIIYDKMLVKISEASGNDNISENINRCQQWLEDCTLNDNKSTCNECLREEDLNSDSASTTDSCSECSSMDVSQSNNPSLLEKTCMSRDQLKSIIGQNQNVYKNILVSKSEKVHLGNVTVFNGPVYIKDGRKRKKSENNLDSNEKPEHLKLSDAQIRFVERRAWLSQPPVGEYDKLQKPAKYVIICHSATEDATSHAENILLIRYIQQFHIECRKWLDIAYNFLIGCDGYTYQGRGWGARGAHSFRYNAISVGICFVGTFCKKLPTQIALEQAKCLIRYGVKQGEIDADYSIIGNCQVSSSKSPGERLYEEIQTWEHYDASVSLENPSPLIQQE